MIEILVNSAVKIVEKAPTVVVENAPKIVAGAGVAAAGAVGAAVDHVVVKKKDEKILREEKKKSYEHGFKDGANVGETIIQQAFVNPILSRISICYYVARADGKLSKNEKAFLNEKTDYFLSNPDLPESVRAEIKKIVTDKDISFENVKVYLDEIDIEQLNLLSEDIDELIGEKKNISDTEEKVLKEFDDYLLSRTEEPQKKGYNLFDGKIIDKTVVDSYVDEYALKMRLLDNAFTLKTRLNKQDISILMIATALQCARIYIVNSLTKIERAGKGKREAALHKKQEELLERIDKGRSKKARRYYAPLIQIAETSGVPYDSVAYKGKYNVFAGPRKGEGANHRFSTLGHDPIIGLVVGTINIMTNTITTVNEDINFPTTFHVEYNSDYKNPLILSDKGASFVVAADKVIGRSKEDITPLVAALLKQMIHIATDMYTPAGIQIPGANLVLSRKNAEVLTKYISYGDMAKFGASAGIDVLINKIVEIVHGAMLMESGKDLEDELNRVKTKKIVLYSNSIATGSNVVASVVTSKYDNLDWAGLIVLLRRVFNDVDFIYDVKREFISRGLGE